MELLVVAGEDLIRSGGRLAAVLARGHNAMMLSLKDYSLSAPPGHEVGVIFLGDDTGHQNVSGAQTVFAQFGITIATQGSRVWIFGTAVADPRETLNQMGEALPLITQSAPMNPNPMVDKTPPRTGAEYASLFLNPKLRVPTQTVAGGFTFSSERMCWERQYTLGIAQFLASGFDPWLHSIGAR